MPPLRIALIQLNVTVGDFAQNRRRIIDGILQATAWRADLALCPELAVTGYPPEDLLLKPRFVEENLRALERIAPFAGALTALVGFVDRGPSGRLHNAAALLHRGRHVATYHKQCLPNYGVFDEKRYFVAGQRPMVMDLGGRRIGVTICEDLWEPWPTEALRRAGAQLVVNISASPYHAGKLRQRQALFATRARQAGAAIAYCNLIGGQDELVFDGASLVLDRRGNVVAVGDEFDEDLVVVDLELPTATRRATAAGQTVRLPATSLPRPPLAKPLKNSDLVQGSRLEVRGKDDFSTLANRASSNLEPRTSNEGVFQHPAGPVEEVYQALVLGTRDYVRKNGFETVVLGLSGGIDSSLVACIAADALGRERAVGVTMPSRFSSTGTRDDAKRLAVALGIRCEELAIEPCFEAFLRTLAPVFGSRAVDVTEQNLQARIRGALLMALSNKFGWLVLTTGNKSEMATGYCTLYGDMAGGLAVIKDVPKTLVYQLARWRNRHTGRPVIPESVFARAPTAELAPNQTDQDTLPPYELLDQILKAYVEEDRTVQDILRQARFEPETVKRVARMVDHSEYKRRQGPPGIKITPKAFGRDRRMPITNRYQQQ